MRIVIAFLLTILGFWGGWALGTDRPTKPAASPAPTGTSSKPIAPSPTASPPAAAVDDAPLVPSEDSPAPDTPPRSSVDDLRPILELFPVRSYETGEEVITGRVADEHGAPVAGVAFDLIVHGTTPGVIQAGVRQPSALAFALEEIDQYHFDAAFMRSAVSGEDGTFRFDRVSPQHKYQVVPGLSNESAVFIDSEESGLSAGAEIVARAHPAVPVTVEVVRGNGSPVEWGSLYLWGEVGGFEWSRRVRVLGAPIELLVPVPIANFSAGSPQGKQAIEKSVALRKGEPATVRLEIHELPTITLDLDFGQDPIERAGVVARFIELEDYAEPPVEDDLQSWLYRGTDFPMGVGAPTRLHVATGDSLILLARDERLIGHRWVTIPAEGLVVSMAVPPIDRSQLTIVSALSPEGDPVEAVDFGWVVEMAYGEEVERVQLPITSTHLGLGIHALRYDTDRIPETSHPLGILTASTPDLGSKEITQPIGNGVRIEVQFDPPARLVVNIPNYVGHGAQGNSGVELWRNGARIKSGSPNVAGVVEFDGLAPGAANLRLKAGWHSNAIGEPIDLQLQPGENFISVLLPGVFSIEVRFPPKLADTFVQISGEGQFAAGARIDANGLVEFRGLPPGQYTVSGMGGVGMSIDVPTAGSVVDYRPVSADALEVQIDEPNGLLARSGLRSGDFITSVFGTETTSVQRLRFAVLRVIGDGAGSIEVERSGSFVTLRIDGEPQEIHLGNLGGSLTSVRRGER